MVHKNISSVVYGCSAQKNQNRFSGSWSGICEISQPSKPLYRCWVGQHSNKVSKTIGSKKSNHDPYLHQIYCNVRSDLGSDICVVRQKSQ